MADDGLITTWLDTIEAGYGDQFGDTFIKYIGLTKTDDFRDVDDEVLGEIKKVLEKRGAKLMQQKKIAKALEAAVAVAKTNNGRVGNQGDGAAARAAGEGKADGASEAAAAAAADGQMRPAMQVAIMALERSKSGHEALAALRSIRSLGALTEDTKQVFVQTTTRLKKRIGADEYTKEVANAFRLCLTDLRDRASGLTLRAAKPPAQKRSMRVHEMHLKCGVCDAALFPGLRFCEYQFTAPSQPHLDREFVTDGSMFNCPLNCHPGRWLVDAGTGLIDRQGHGYAGACGNAFCVASYEAVEVAWDPAGTWDVTASAPAFDEHVFNYTLEVLFDRSGGVGIGGGGGGGGSGGCPGAYTTRVVFPPQNGFPRMDCAAQRLVPVDGKPNDYEGRIAWRGEDGQEFGTSVFRITFSDSAPAEGGAEGGGAGGYVHQTAATGQATYVQGEAWDDGAVVGSMVCVRRALVGPGV
eukprot:g2460.t1